MKPLIWLCVAWVALSAAAAAAAPPMADDVRNYGFRVEIPGLGTAMFRSVDGLSIEQEVIEFRAGGDTLVRKLPGRVKYGDITLKRGFVAPSMLTDWIQPTALGGEGSPRKDIMIVVLDRQNGQELARWELFNCFPAKWQGPTLEGRTPQVPIESLTVACDYFVER